MIKVTDEAIHQLPGPNQIAGEWEAYLRYLQAYCERFSITRPVVLEIGTQFGKQKAHYERFLDAWHIGVDISDKYSKPDILGDSHDPATLHKVKTLLNGRDVNFLFLDGAHTYADTMLDYVTFGPLARDIIAMHDIRHEKEIGRLWADLQKAGADEPDRTFVSIGGWGNGWCELGIGLVVKRHRIEFISE